MQVRQLTQHRIIVIGAGYAGAIAAYCLPGGCAARTSPSPSSTPSPTSWSGSGCTSSRSARS